MATGNDDTGGFKIERAGEGTAAEAMRIVRQAREVFPFLPRSVYERAVAEGKLLLCRNGAGLAGCLHFHHRRDGITTVHEFAVVPEERGRGAGRALLDALEQEARARGQKRLRVKCPVDQPANGFYTRVGFQRVAIEAGRRRHVAVWERPIRAESSGREGWQFYASMTAGTYDLRRVIRQYYETYAARGEQPPFHPFRRMIFTPLFCSQPAFRVFKELASESPDPAVTLLPSLPRPAAMFDSGGYQVQLGRMPYEELCARLRALYDAERWADWYVLPDHVPTSADSDTQASRQADDTLSVGENFLHWFPERRDRFIGVVHGRTEADMRRGAEHWSDLGVRYIAFGSFGTSGPNGGVNLVSTRSLRLLRALAEAAGEGSQLVHIFGIGNPGYLQRLSDAGATADSFDSSGWWKMAGFGYVLCDERFANICSRGRMTKTLSALRNDLPESQHSCPFCADTERLREDRWLRVLHNLVCYGETVGRNHGSVDLLG